MKKILCTLFALFISAINPQISIFNLQFSIFNPQSSLGATFAQTNLTGRVYYNPNILEKEMTNMTKDVDKKITESKSEAIKKAEEKKGRKLTEAELAEIDKQMEKAKKMLEAIKKGMKTAITMTFKDEKNVVMKTDMKIDDDAMKAAGIPWAKRKLLKVATAISPSEKGTYTVKGNQIYIDDGSEEKDTMRLSDDGKHIYGKMDDKTKFTLTRIK